MTRLSTVMAMAMAMGCVAGCGAPGQGVDEPVAVNEASLEAPHGANPQLFALDSYPYGISMEEWAYNWMRWEYSIPAATNPTIVVGANYDQHQLGPVYFVPDGPTKDDAFTVPRYKSVAIMLSQIANDYPCPDPTFKPAPGQSLYDFLMAGIAGINDNITVMNVTLDGVPIVDPLSYRIVSPRLFYFAGDKSLDATFDACVTGSLQPAVTDDVFILLKPLARGRHTLVTHIENSDGGVFDRTRTITSD